MDLIILDKNFNPFKNIDIYKSLIWTERYDAYGDFELYTLFDSSLLEVFKMGYYITCDKFDTVMIIEKIEMSSDIETGRVLIISGRSLESILCRRSIYNQTTLSGDLYHAIYRILYENVISPSVNDRKIDNFYMPQIKLPESLKKVETQFTGDDLYSAIQKLVIDRGVGFKIVLNKNWNGSFGSFYFNLYIGEDRSYNQNENPYIVFSSSFDNLISTDYKKDGTNFGNFAIIAGEGEGANRRKYYMQFSRSIDDSENFSGLDRYEVFIDARDISSDTEEGILPPSVYDQLLSARGSEKMVDRIIQEDFQASIDTSQMYVYGRDFFIGDIVQIETDFGISHSARIKEHIYSESNDGVKEYSTFVFTVKGE